MVSFNFPSRFARRAKQKPVRPALGRTGRRKRSNEKRTFATTVVIAGLDPAIHHLRKSFFRWIRGSSPRMTSGASPPVLFRLQLQRGGIDAVAQAGRAGAVLEDVAEMAVALRAKNLGADHAVA